jgi:stage IV sporulation protein FB
MFLLEPGRTAYDLNWRMFGIDVRVHPMFWLIGAIMGFNLLQISIALFLVWMACVFVSILIHEMGHVVMGQLCGTTGHIVLYAFGGIAVPHRHLHKRWQRIAFCFAGPLAGFLFFGIVLVGFLFLGAGSLHGFFGNLLTAIGIDSEVENGAVAWHPMMYQAVDFLLFINLTWGLVNLLPIWPLDGGQISREVFDGLWPRGRGVEVSLTISLIVAGLVTLQCITARFGRPLLPFLPSFGGFGMVMFGLLAFESFQLLQQARYTRRRPWDDNY